MKILILGGYGMLGHQLLNSLATRHDVKVTLRRPLADHHSALFNADNSYDNIDVTDLEQLNKILNDFQPDAIINAIGVIKQRPQAQEHIPSIEINALFPHKLAALAATYQARVIHISTDCVFSGTRGNYTEDDRCNVEDIYGLTKFLGELTEPHCVTIRSSIIGLELARKQSLIEWFLAQQGDISGYKNAIYTGVTTQEMSRIIDYILTKQVDLQGLWHITAEPINKFDLLTQLNQYLQRDVCIKPNTEFHCDRSLNGDRFAAKTGFQVSSWATMLQQLAEQVQLREKQAQNI